MEYTAVLETASCNGFGSSNLPVPTKYINNADVVELVYTTDLKSVAFGIEGSSPSISTNYGIKNVERFYNYTLVSIRL